MRARKIDRNLPAIAEAAEKAGFMVHRTNADWDLTVNLLGTVELWEVKATSKSKHTELQKKLLAAGWPIRRVESVEDVIERRNRIVWKS